MVYKYLLVSLLAFVCLTYGGDARSASFECNAATHISEKVICMNSTLSIWEEKYVESYQFAVSQGGSFRDQAKAIAARQMSLRRRCRADAECIYNVLLKAERLLSDLGFAALDDASESDSGATESVSWQSLEPLSIDQLTSLYRQFDASCRGSGTGMQIVEDCPTRNEVGDYLKRMRGWCYGKRTQSTFEYAWHECEKDSY